MFRSSNKTNYSNAVNTVLKHVANQFSTLRDRASTLLTNTNKDFFCVYGWPREVSEDQFWFMAERNAIANFVSDGMAHDCWANGFELQVNDKGILEGEIRLLARNGLFRDLERADRMNRRNRFSICLVQLDDGLRLDQPLGKARTLKSVKLRPFREGGVQISKYETDPTSPRFGLPVEYQASIIADGQDSKDTNLSTINIHYTRVILLNEGQTDSNITGESALKPIVNELINLNKTIGGSAEAYYRNASPKYTLTSKDDTFNTAYMESAEFQGKLDDNVNKFVNDMKPFLMSGGFDVNTLSTPHASPRDSVLASLWSISAQTGVPIRILTGEGSGQLAGSEDKLKYNTVINDRQSNECARYVYQLIDILSSAGLINVPEDYTVCWPKEEPSTEMQAAEIADKKASALLKASQALSMNLGGLVNEVSPRQAVEEILGLVYEPEENDMGEMNGNIDESDIDGSGTDQADD